MDDPREPMHEETAWPSLVSGASRTWITIAVEQVLRTGAKPTWKIAVTLQGLTVPDELKGESREFWDQVVAAALKDLGAQELWFLPPRRA